MTDPSADHTPKLLRNPLLNRGTAFTTTCSRSSNTSSIEVMPQGAIRWSDGKILLATGIPVDPYEYKGTTYVVGQANNSLLYPGLGLGTIAAGATHVTDGMLLAAAQAVASQVDPTPLGASLLPPVRNLRASSAITAFAVAKAAAQDGVATREPDDLTQAVQNAMWQPVDPTVEA